MRLPFLSLAAGAALASAGAANAAIVNFVFPINSTQEVPSPTLPGAGAPEPLGMGNVTYDTDTNLLSWTISYENLTGGVVSPGAHFHGPAAPGATAGIKVFISDGDPPDPATGVFTGSATIDEADEPDLLGGLWYVNLHTAMNQSGEIRGQVVPTPGAASLGLLGAGGLLVLRRRRK